MEAKEQKILAAAFRLFHQHGYRKVTMSELAEASAMSRPSLYAAFANKEAVVAGLCRQAAERCESETEKRIGQAKQLEQRLTLLFEVWIVEPASSVVGAPSGLELLGTVASYAPEAVDDIYARFERHVVAALKPELVGKRGMSARDMAHIMVLASRGLKASATSMTELRRLTEGLVAMAVATVKGMNAR